MHILLFTLGGVTEKKVLYVNVYLLLVFACGVMLAMLDGENNNLSHNWEQNFINMQII